MSSWAARSTTPHNVPWTPWITHLAAPALRPAVGVQGAQHPVPQALGLVNGDQGVENVVLAAALARHGHHHQESLLRVQFRLAVQHRVLEGVLPALG